MGDAWWDDDPVDDIAGEVDAGRGRRRGFDPGSLLMGSWFVIAGVLAAAAGADGIDGTLPVVLPVSFAVCGVGLIVPKRRAR